MWNPTRESKSQKVSWYKKYSRLKIASVFCFRCLVFGIRSLISATRCPYHCLRFVEPCSSNTRGIKILFLLRRFWSWPARILCCLNPFLLLLHHSQQTATPVTSAAASIWRQSFLASHMKIAASKNSKVPFYTSVYCAITHRARPPCTYAAIGATVTPTTTRNPLRSRTLAWPPPKLRANRALRRSRTPPTK